MNNYVPDKWVMLKIATSEKITYKILAGWVGGYMQGQSWKLNSGCFKVEQDGDYFIFHGYSGSTYECHKKSYGYTVMTIGVLNSFETQLAAVKGMTIDVLSETTNFMEIDYEN